MFSFNGLVIGVLVVIRVLEFLKYFYIFYVNTVKTTIVFDSRVDTPVNIFQNFKMRLFDVHSSSRNRT